MASNEFKQAANTLVVQLPVQVAANSKALIWSENCRNFAQLKAGWHGGQIVRSGGICYTHHNPRCFEIDQTIMDAVFEGRTAEIMSNVVRNSTNCDSKKYVNCLKLLLEVEEIYQAVEMRKHDIQQQQLTHSKRGRLDIFGFRMPNLPEKSPSIIRGDYVVIDNLRGLRLALNIYSVDKDYIELPPSAYERYKDELKLPMKVSFISAGYSFNCQQKAIELLRRRRSMQSLVFQEVGRPSLALKIDVAETSTQELEERLQELDGCQRAAVIGILEARCRPKPYILFGPPGTGKTRTLVEAIVQVYKRTRLAPLKEYYSEDDDDEDSGDCDIEGRDSKRICLATTATDTSSSRTSQATGVRILVCINSNNCRIELHQQIRRELPDAIILRLSAGDFFNRSEEFEILTTTNMKSSSLSEAKCMFDYVFVDEAGHANVAESLIPACVLKRGGCLVLAGDPHQLGPIIMCEKASELGLGMSLLERLIKFEIYQKDARTREYDRRFITMLRDCYRCDARILSTCNRLIYGNALRCLGETPRGLLRMLQLSWPLQLRHVAGRQTKIDGSDSMFNQEEIYACVDLVKRLYCTGIEPSQIGVTSPYKLQTNKIRAALKRIFSSNSEIAINLGNRFAQNEFVHASELKTVYELHRRLEDLKLPLNSKLYRRNGEQYVECDFDGSGNLYVRGLVRAARCDCKVDTIDAFQGGEKEIMIISTVRTEGSQQSLRFITDRRRFNVAVSRAKWLVIVIGDSQVLERVDYWSDLLAETMSQIDAWPKRVQCASPFSQTPLFRAH